ncbi:hypothetical protein HY991_04840 [Candidatus Micrarchaeota archaeon]|nr:hypothetical protein [Candidatus Micrarchaeota archaeon]
MEINTLAGFGFGLLLVVVCVAFLLMQKTRAHHDRHFQEAANRIDGLNKLLSELDAKQRNAREALGAKGSAADLEKKVEEAIYRISELEGERIPVVRRR